MAPAHPAIRSGASARPMTLAIETAFRASTCCYFYLVVMLPVCEAVLDLVRKTLIGVGYKIVHERCTDGYGVTEC